MKFSPLKSLFVLSTVVSASMAFSSLPVKEITFDQFKEACKNPDGFSRQIAPTNIQATCKDVQYKWALNTPGEIKLPNSRYVTTAMTSDKYSAKAKTDLVKTDDQSAQCFRYKQIAETVQVSRALTCEAILAYPGTGVEYCQEVADAIREENPAAIVVVDTGATLDFCTPKEGNSQRGQTGNNR